jgi:hypothetical protein
LPVEAEQTNVEAVITGLLGTVHAVAPLKVIFEGRAIC